MIQDILNKFTPKPLREHELPNPFRRSGFTESQLGEEAGFWTDETYKSGRRKVDRKKTRDLLNELLNSGKITKGDKERTMHCGSKYIQVYHVVEFGGVA